MRRAASIVVIVFVALGLGVATDFVGLHYVETYDNQSLLAPVRVSSVEPRRITLEDGRSFTFSPLREDEKLEAGELVDVEPFGMDSFALYANRKRFICGTPWAKPIVIPLIPSRFPRYRREFVMTADLETPGA